MNNLLIASIASDPEWSASFIQQCHNVEITMLTGISVLGLAFHLSRVPPMPELLILGKSIFARLVESFKYKSAVTGGA